MMEYLGERGRDRLSRSRDAEVIDRFFFPFVTWFKKKIVQQLTNLEASLSSSIAAKQAYIETFWMGLHKIKCQTYASASCCLPSSRIERSNNTYPDKAPSLRRDEQLYFPLLQVVLYLAS